MPPPEYEEAPATSVGDGNGASPAAAVDGGGRDARSTATVDAGG
jgi:hypothetical protein